MESRHLLYLQLRKSVLEKQILCTEDDQILLGGLALQAEVGDFQENVIKCGCFPPLAVVSAFVLALPYLLYP